MQITQTERPGRAPLVRGAGEGRTTTLRGASVTRVADGGETGGAWSLLEYVAPPHFEGPAPHWHAETTEAFYILEGTLAFTVGGETVTAAAGGFVLVPTGVVHAFFNATAAPVRFLTFCIPGGFERYFDDLSALLATAAEWPPKDTAPLEALWARYDIRHDPPPAR